MSASKDAVSPKLAHPWLVAVWPGMGGVAQIAGTFLARAVRAQALLELDPRPFFDPQAIVVQNGLATAAARPKSAFYAWRDPAGRRDLLIMLAEQQPTQGLRYADALMDVAVEFGVERVVTFAAMATPVHPSSAPRVFGVATRTGLLNEIQREGATLLEDGEISGLNGVFVTAAAARGIASVCLLGEFPFFAAQLPNPRASAAVLEVFAKMFGTTLDLEPLYAQAAKIQETLVEHLGQLQQAAEQSVELANGNGGPNGGPPGAMDAPEAEAPQPPKERPVPKEVIERIDALFAQAQNDRQKALELKLELDRQGLFRRYEDRFLDLFKKAG